MGRKTLPCPACSSPQECHNYLFVECQLTSTSQVEQTTVTSAFKHQRETLKTTESTKQNSLRMPPGCLWLSFGRIVTTLFWRQWTYWTSFLSAIDVSRIKGVCAHVCVSAPAWQEVRWLKEEEGRKNGQLKKKWKMRVDESPDLRLCSSWKMNRIVQRGDQRTYLFQRHSAPSELHSLSLLKEPRIPFIVGKTDPSYRKWRLWADLQLRLLASCQVVVKADESLRTSLNDICLVTVMCQALW